MTMTQTPASARRFAAAARMRPWAALAAAVVVFALIPLGALPLTLAVPVIGVVLACGAPPDHVPDARPVARVRRNGVVAALLAGAAAVVVLHPQLRLPLVQLAGPDLAELVVALLSVGVLALPLAMTQAPTRVDERPAHEFVPTRRNLILSLTVVVTVATWYSGPGLSFLVIAVFVLTVPVLLVVTRLLAARRGRLDYTLLRQPLRPGLAWHRLQLANVLLLCIMLALLLRSGAYAATALGLTPGAQRVFQGAFLTGLAALVLVALVPLRRPRLGSNLLALAGTAFVAAQLVMIYRPAAEPVTIASPLADEWLVAQGGHAELVNYHQVTSTQSDALDIEQLVDGRAHRPGSDLAGYAVYDKALLAPADGIVTWVLDGRPDLPVGSVDTHYQAGNQVVIDIGGQRYLMMGHLRQNSIRVKVGDRMTAGQPIARIGNSGSTDRPHLHIQAQSLPTGIGDVQTADVAELLRTLHTYPLVVRDVVLTRGDTRTQPAAADPRRGDLLRPTG